MSAFNWRNLLHEKIKKIKNKKIKKNEMIPLTAHRLGTTEL